MNFINVPDNARSKYKNINLNLIFSFMPVDYNTNIGARNENKNKFIWGVEFIDLNKTPIEVMFDNKENRDNFLHQINDLLFSLRPQEKHHQQS